MERYPGPRIAAEAAAAAVGRTMTLGPACTGMTGATAACSAVSAETVEPAVLIGELRCVGVALRPATSVLATATGEPEFRGTAAAAATAAVVERGNPLD